MHLKSTSRVQHRTTHTYTIPFAHRAPQGLVEVTTTMEEREGIVDGRRVRLRKVTHSHRLLVPTTNPTDSPQEVPQRGQNEDHNRQRTG